MWTKEKPKKRIGEMCMTQILHRNDPIMKAISAINLVVRWHPPWLSPFWFGCYTHKPKMFRHQYGHGDCVFFSLSLSLSFDSSLPQLKLILFLGYNQRAFSTQFAHRSCSIIAISYNFGSVSSSFNGIRLWSLRTDMALHLS